MWTFRDNFKGPLNPYFKKSRNTITLNKTMDQFKDEPSETSLRALKTFTFKKPVNTITLQELNYNFNIWNSDWSQEEFG